MIRASIIVKGVEKMHADHVRAQKKASDVLRRERQKAAYFIESEVKRDYTTTLHVRSGLLRSSVVVTPRRIVKQEDISVGTPIRYAASHEDGATVRASGKGRTYIAGRRVGGQLSYRQSKGSMLTIPIGQAAAVGIAARRRAAKTAAGVAQAGFADQIALSLSRGRAFGTFISKSGRAILMRVGSEIIPVAALKAMVRIPRRPVWAKALRAVERRLPAGVVASLEREIR